MPEAPSPDAPRDFTAQQKHREIMREIGQRENVYPRLVAQGRLHPDTAARQIAIMRAIAQYYAERHLNLFGEGVL